MGVSGWIKSEVNVPKPNLSHNWRAGCLAGASKPSCVLTDFALVGKSLQKWAIESSWAPNHEL